MQVPKGNRVRFPAKTSQSATPKNQPASNKIRYLRPQHSLLQSRRFPIVSASAPAKRSQSNDTPPVMNHCYIKTRMIVLAMLAACFAGCQYTASTSPNHNAQFDFGQRPRFFGTDPALPSPALPQLASQTPQLPQLTGPTNGGSLTSGGGPIRNLFASFGKKTPTQPSSFGSTLGGGLASGNNVINTNSPEQYQQLSQMANEVNNLSTRLNTTDSDNQLLNTEVAGLRQKLELANQYNQTLKEQLADTSGRIQQSELARQQAIAQSRQLQQQMQTAGRSASTNSSPQFGSPPANPFSQASNTAGSDRFASSSSANGNGEAQFASATIRANNSLMRRLSEIRIPGGEARMDGDVIRIEFPSDRMFVAGTYQIAPAQRPVLSDIVSTVRRSFPRQIVGVEAHWDNTPLNPPGTTAHQLTATQSLAVFEELIRLGLPQRQLFTMAMASNRPRHSSGTVGGVNPNRRIELVIYPETWDGP